VGALGGALEHPYGTLASLSFLSCSSSFDEQQSLLITKAIITRPNIQPAI